MELIDKAAVVAEIERIKNEECPTDTYEGRCKLLWFEQFLSFLNTLEVKEVNLEQEIDKVKKMQRNFEIKNDTIVEFCAKHFYELGLKAKKGE